MRNLKVFSDISFADITIIQELSWKFIEYVRIGTEEVEASVYSLQKSDGISDTSVDKKIHKYGILKWRCLKCR